MSGDRSYAPTVSKMVTNVAKGLLDSFLKKKAK